MDKNRENSSLHLKDEQYTNGFSSNGVVLNAKHLEAYNGETKTEGKESEKPTRKESSLRLTIFGFMCGLVGSLLVATGTSCAQALHGAVPDFQLASSRGFFQMLFASCGLMFSRLLPKVARKHIIWVIFYAVFAASFNITNYLSINYIAVGTASCVRRSLSLFLIVLLSRIVLKEGVTVMKVLSVVISAVGVILIIQPWYEKSEPETDVATLGLLEYHHSNYLLDKFQELILGHVAVTAVRTKVDNLYGSYFNTTDSNNSTILPTGAPYVGSSLEEEILGYILALTAGVCLTFEQTVHKAKLQKYNSLVLNFYAGFVGIVTPFILSVATEDMTFPSEGSDIGLFIGQSICSGLAMLILTRAVSLTSPVLIAVAMSLQVVFLLIAQYTVLADIQPSVGNWVEITGAVLAVLAAFLPPAWQITKSQLNKRSKEKNGETDAEFCTHL